MHHVVLYPAQQLLEHLLAFGLVHHQRVALADCLEADAGAQVFQVGQVLHPVSVDGPEQQ
jgi:hypothetical protein